MIYEDNDIANLDEYETNYFEKMAEIIDYYIYWDNFVNDVITNNSFLNADYITQFVRLVNIKDKNDWHDAIHLIFQKGRFQKLQKNALCHGLVVFAHRNDILITPFEQWEIVTSKNIRYRSLEEIHGTDVVRQKRKIFGFIRD